MQLKGIPWRSAPIRVSRRLWLLCTTAAFLALGSWRWIEMKGPAFSLFDWGWAVACGICVDMRDSPADVLTGMCLLLVWCAGYAAVSAGIGWLVAAGTSAVIQTASWRKSQRRE